MSKATIVTPAYYSALYPDTVHTEDAEPCPFCGCIVLFIGKPEKREDGQDDFIGVDCRDCDATGPLGRGVKEAIELWNKRNK